MNRQWTSETNLFEIQLTPEQLIKIQQHKLFVEFSVQWHVDETRVLFDDLKATLIEKESSAETLQDISKKLE